MEEIAVNAFDNSYTTLLKTAVSQGIPTSWLLVEGEVDGQPNYSRWDLEFQDLPFTQDWLETQYATLAPRYPALSPVLYCWQLVARWYGEPVPPEGTPAYLERTEDATPDTLLDAVNTFSADHKEPTYRTVEDLEASYAVYQATHARVLAREQVEAFQLQQQQRLLEDQAPMPTTELVLLSEQYELVCVPVSVWTTLQEVPLSLEVPWVLTTALEGYDGPVLRALDRVPAGPWALMPQMPLAQFPAGHLWAAVWARKEEPTPASVDALGDKGYVFLDIDLRARNVVFRLPKNEATLPVDAWVARLEVLLPGLTFGAWERVRVQGEFRVPGLELSEYVLAELITNDPLVRAYLLLNEQDSTSKKENRIGALYARSRLIVYYRSGTTDTRTLHASLNQSYEGRGGTPYVLVTINQGVSERVSLQFQEIFARLLTYYKSQADTVLSRVRSVVGPTATGILSIRKSERLAPTALTRNELLQQAFPGLVVKGYATSCQGKNQPAVADAPEDVPAGAQTLEYPLGADDAKVLYCPDPTAPFPTILQNNTASKDVLPYLPCCTAKNQLDNPSSALFKVYVEGLDPQEVFQAAVRTTRQTLALSARAALPGLILEMARLPLSAVRLGSQPGPSSLLVCMAQAQGLTDALSEDALRGLRGGLGRGLGRGLGGARGEGLEGLGGLLAQELWDMPLLERVAWLRDPERFLDPQLFFRVLEETYDLNLYLFTATNDKNKTGMVLLPRFSQFPCRPFRARRCVLLYVPPGENHCELIIDGARGTRIWDEGVNQRLHTLWTDLARTEVRTPGGVLVNPQNSYPWHRHTQATHQLLDGFGKLRGLVFGTQKLTLHGPPGAPVALPPWPEGTPTPAEGTDTLVVALMDGVQPTETSETAWVYRTAGVEVVWPRHPVPPAPLDLLDRQQRCTSLLLQLGNLFFLLATERTLDPARLRPWLSTRTVVRPDPAYDPSTLLSPYLPTWTSEAEAVADLESMLPSFFEAGRLVLPSLGFQERMENYMQRFCRMYSAAPVVQPTVLLGTDLAPLPGRPGVLRAGGAVDVARAKGAGTELVSALTPALLAARTPIVVQRGAQRVLVLPAASKDAAAVITDNWKAEGRVVLFQTRPPPQVVEHTLSDTGGWAPADLQGFDVLVVDGAYAALLPLVPQ